MSSNPKIKQFTTQFIVIWMLDDQVDTNITPVNSLTISQEKQSNDHFMS